MAYRDIADSEIDRNSPVTETLMTALRDNPTGIAQRDPGAPRIQPPSIEVLDTPGSGTWTVPAGVTRVRATIIGGGGRIGADGDDSTLNDGATTYIGGGGGGGSSAANTPGGSGGTASNGDLNLTGQTGGTDNGIRAAGGQAPVYSGYGIGTTNGGGGSAGGGGGAAVVNMAVSPGGSLAYAVGGPNGAIILEY